jgi:hypothetical protein
MKVNSLQKQDKSVLADFYESPEYKSLRKVMGELQLEWAQAAVTAPTMEDLRELRGQINAFRKLEDLLKTNHKQNVQKSVPLT